MLYNYNSKSRIDKLGEFVMNPIAISDVENIVSSVLNESYYYSGLLGLFEE
jgi:hypothetical protein